MTMTALSNGPRLLMALAGLTGTLLLTHCGGTVRDPGAGRTGDGSGNASGRSSGSGASRGEGGRGNTDGGPGGTGSGSGVSGDGGASGRGGSEQGGKLPDGGKADPESFPPAPSTDLLKELSKLHMDQDLSTVVSSPCTTTLSLDWDLDRDGTTDATETRILDASGRLAAAEISGSRGGGPTARKRALFSYDGAGRPTQYLYGIEGQGLLEPWVGECASPSPEIPRGTVVDIGVEGEWHVVRSVSAESCHDAQPASCDTLTFDSQDRFLARRGGCSDLERTAFEPQFDQTRTYDVQGRPIVDSFKETPAVSRWSDVTYDYPSPDTQATSWTEDMSNDACACSKNRKLTRTLLSDGRPIHAEFDAESDGVAEEIVSYTYDKDGCGSVESTDFWHDGVPDLVTTTTCSGGRVTHREERNMAQINDTTGDGPNAYYRHTTPLGAAPQSDVTLDVTFDDVGQATDEKYDITTLQRIYDIALSQEGSFSRTDAVRSTGRLDLSVHGGQSRGSGSGVEASNATCRIETTCPSAAPSSPELTRCELGIGVSVLPRIYERVPGGASLSRLRTAYSAWMPMPETYVVTRPDIRAIVGY
jgi:hypothetical protein